MNKKKTIQTSLYIPESVNSKVFEIASDENVKPATIYRKLINAGLREYGIRVKNNQVVES